MTAGRRGTLLAASVAALWPGAAAAQESALQLRYDVSVAWLNGGQLRADLSEYEGRYELGGRIATSGMMDRFFSWRGAFAATGLLVQGYPRTTTYLLIDDNGKKREMLLSTSEGTTVHTTNRASKHLPAPPGSDLMSVLFLAPHCLPEAAVHDGEDAYQLRLVKKAPVSLRQKARYHSGATERCDYRFRYEDGTTRRISLWMAEWRGQRLPVRIRVRIPLLPDVLLRLRNTDAG